MRKYEREVPRLEKEGMEILLHYIGKRYYTIETFTKEALKHGVSRALPASVIKKLKWGDRVYTAFYEKDEKGPYALVFGYFIITGLNVTDVEVVEEAKKDERLKVVKVVAPAGGGGRVTRGCGSYEVGGTTYVDNSLDELVDIIEDTAKKMGKKVKIMVAGRFQSTPLIAIRGISFTRGLLRVRIPEDTFRVVTREIFEEPAGLTGLKGYRLGRPSKRRKRKVKEALESSPLDKWLGG